MLVIFDIAELRPHLSWIWLLAIDNILNFTVNVELFKMDYKVWIFEQTKLLFNIGIGIGIWFIF